MTISKIAAVVAFVALLSLAALAQSGHPQGRLTLTSNTPVMTSDVTGTSTIYYTPYQGPQIPIYNGSWANYTSAGQLTLTLDSSYQTVGNIYDVFAILSSGSPIIAVNETPWSSLTSRGASGAVAISQVSGIWVNTYGSGSVVLNNGTTQYSISGVNTATYLGSIYIPTTAGETSVQFKPSAAAGGSNNFIGIWNAYNRVPVFSLCRDSNTSWTDSSSSWEALDFASSSGVNNRVTYVDGLAQSAVKGRVTTIGYNATAGNGVFIGVDEDSTTASPDVYASQQSATSGTTVGSISFAAEENFVPALGLHYLQGMQWSPNATTATFGFNGSSTSLLFQGEY